MTDRTQPYGRLRVLGLFVLVAGVMIMHAVVFGAGHAGAVSHAATTQMSTAHAAMPPAAHSSDPACDGCGAGHTGMHACVFVLSALAFALGLVALAWLGADPGDTAGPVARARLARHPRPPPWTVLSLPELSILRI
ncbi:DUF6153 family protein [Nocardia sp. NPDC051570]|uniref:DUF6153 family protein n=1 Tax=Nocardia sp. NPDC051570 TaxID=3364324 RepID=UPI0037B98569